MLNNLHIWVFIKWELKELKFRIEELLLFLVISKKPHRTAGFHENPEKRSQVGFWAFIWDLGFKTSIDRQTELTKNLKKSFAASPAFPFPHPPKPPSQTQRLTKLIYIIYFFL